jgi:DNA replication licensing factor MCM6
MMDGTAQDGDGDSPMNGDGGPAQPVQKTKITYDKYMKILNLLVRRVDATDEGVEHDDLLLWYLEQIENELGGVEEMETEKALASKVLKRMVKVCKSIRPWARKPSLSRSLTFSYTGLYPDANPWGGPGG